MEMLNGWRSPVSQWWEVSCATSLFTNRLPSVPYLYYWFYSAGQVCLTPYLFLPSQCLLTTNSVYRHQQFFCGLHHCVSSNHKLSVQTSAVFPSSLLLSVSSNLKLSVQTSAFLFLVITFVLHIIVQEKLCLHTIKTQYEIHKTIVLSLKLCVCVGFLRESTNNYVACGWFISVYLMNNLNDDGHVTSCMHVCVCVCLYACMLCCLSGYLMWHFVFVVTLMSYAGHVLVAAKVTH